MLRRFSAGWRRRLVSEINASQRTLRGVLQPIKWAWPQWRNHGIGQGGSVRSRGGCYECTSGVINKQYDKLNNAADNQCCPDNNFCRVWVILFLLWGEVDLFVESRKGCNERHIKVVGI